MHTRSAIDTAHLFERVKEAVPLAEMIEYLQLRRRGRSIRCPNHQAHKHGDRNPSAYISESGWSWHCYGCQVGGTVLDLVMAAQGLSRTDAAVALAEYAGLPLSPAERGLSHGGPVPLPQAPVRRHPTPDPPPPPAGPSVHAFLAAAQERLPTSDQATAYLAKRGVPLAIAKAAGLGFAPRGTWPNARGRRQPRIVAPLTSPDGTLLTLYGRSTVLCEKSLRHDFLPGAKGIFNAPALAQDRVILVEGVFDALACLAGGLPAAAICGLAIREAWWNAIPATTLILALDADEAGQRDGAELANTAVQTGKRILIMKPEHLVPHKDLSEYWTRTSTLPAALHRAVVEANHEPV